MLKAVPPRDARAAELSEPTWDAVNALIWVTVKAAACVAVSEHHMRLTLTEGKYHQVKRMVAAV